ncbi:MAG: exodeoxyribonuclease V subunit gamma [Myxococcota bacterium]|nr:exodeoxyribonuclease V subunit gamma [Myxococcota bacterium]
MLHLCYSNQLEVLTAPIAERIKAQQRDQPLGTIQIVVPHPTMGQYLRLAVASHIGQCANVEICVFQSFLRQWVAHHEPALEILDRTALQLLLYARFMDERFMQQHDLDAVAAYMRVANHDTEREARGYQIAGEMAHLFEEYSYTRREMLASWCNNASTTKMPWRSTEDWQRRLWLGVFDGKRRVKTAHTHGAAQNTQRGFVPPHGQSTAMMLLDAFHAAWSHRHASETFHFFGFSYLSAGVAEVLTKLAKSDNVYVYAQNPCLEFWEDLQTSGLSTLQLDWQRRHAERQQGEANHARMDVLNDQGDTPALRLWGRPGREHIRLLNALTECEFATGFVDPTRDEYTVLARLQRDILLRAPERTRDQALDSPDDSVSIDQCVSARHEIEIVAQRIWSHLSAPTKPGDDALRFHDIAVLIAARDRTPYMSHLMDIFEHHHGIPFRIIDGAVANEPQPVSALRQLLSIAREPLNPEALIDIALNPLLRGPSADERRPWPSWIRALNGGWGLDRAQIEGSYLAGTGFHWDRAVQRLVLGLFMDDEDDERLSTAATGQQHDTPPLQVPEAHHDSAAELVYLLRDLLSDFRFMQQKRLSLTQWCGYLDDFIDRYIDCQTEDDEATVTRILGRLDALASADLEGVELPFSLVAQMLDAMFAGINEGHGGYRLDGVAASALMPMRSLPFKVVFIVGLNEGEFPAIDHPNPLDLRQAYGRLGDVTGAMRDRYVFLEAILGTRAHLHLSYIGLDTSDGEPIEPSAVVKEFEYIIRQYLGDSGLETIRFRHDLGSVTSSAYLSPQKNFITALKDVTSDRRSHRGIPTVDTASSTSGTLAALINQHEAPISRPKISKTQVPLSGLLHFLESPLQASARYALGLPFHMHPLKPADGGAPIALNYANHLNILTRCFWSMRQDGEHIEQTLDAIYTHYRHRNAVPIDLFEDFAKETVLKTLRRWHSEALSDGLFPLDNWPRLYLGRGPAGVRTRILLDPLHLGPVDKPIILEGELERLHPDRHTIVSFTLKAQPDHRDFLPGFFTLVVLAARQATLPTRVRVLVKSLRATPTLVHQRIYTCPPTALARSWLEQLGHEVLHTFHGYRLPLSIAMKWFDAQSHMGGARVALAPRQKTEDDRGPIADLSTFSCPPQNEAVALIKSRFGFWFTAGHS